MTLYEIHENKEISIRSYNVCRANRINNITDLKEYYSKYGSFDKLKNCGRKSNEELISICNKYPLITSQNINREVENESIEKTQLHLTRIQREVINSFINVNTNSLSARSKNAISQFLDYNFSVRNFTEKILLKEFFNINSIENVGKKSIPELEIYISIIRDFIKEVSQLNNEKKLITLKNNFLIHKVFSISNVPDEILQSESIFQLTDFLLKNYAFFSKHQNSIVLQALKFYQQQKDTSLDEIAIRNNLSRERVRQIRKESLNELFDKISFIKNFNDDLLKNYSIDISTNLIKIKEDLVLRINDTNNTSFSKEFITYILAVYLSDYFFIIGDIKDILQPKSFNNRNRHNWKDFYIIAKHLSKINFISFADDINERITERIEESYSFNFKSYLSRFFSDTLDIDILDTALPIAEKIVNDEFGIYLDIHENITFNRNTIKQAYEYSYEALESIGQPAKVEDITLKIVQLYPNYETDNSKVRASMKRKDGFVPIGRTSVFGLKKWEQELDNFKGGTIRSIAFEFLEKFDVPKHISDITKHILKYRPKSNNKSIYYNLKIDESQNFLFFKNSFIGLKSIKYSDDLELLEDYLINNERNTWEESYNDLVQFLDSQNRLPFSNDVSNEELKLYRWISNQKRKVKLGELTPQREELFNKLLVNYKFINGRRRLNSSVKYNELFDFLKKNNRLPNASKLNEGKIYQFFYKQRKLYKTNDLDHNEKASFLEIKKILKDLNL